MSPNLDLENLIMNVSTFLEMAAGTFGDRIALTCGAEVVTYRCLADHSHHAAALAKAGGAKHLSLLATSSPVTAVGLFRAASAGRPFVPLIHSLTA